MDGKENVSYEPRITNLEKDVQALKNDNMIEHSKMNENINRMVTDYAVTAERYRSIQNSMEKIERVSEKTNEQITKNEEKRLAESSEIRELINKSQQDALKRPLKKYDKITILLASGTISFVLMMIKWVISALSGIS